MSPDLGKYIEIRTRKYWKIWKYLHGFRFWQITCFVRPHARRCFYVNNKCFWKSAIRIFEKSKNNNIYIYIYCFLIRKNIFSESLKLVFHIFCLIFWKYISYFSYFRVLISIYLHKSGLILPIRTRLRWRLSYGVLMLKGL